MVDDEVYLAKIIRLTLEHAGYEAVLAYDGRQALEMVEAERPDLVILDLMLPLLDGYKVCNAIKNGDATRNIPVIILTARDLARTPIEEPISANRFMEKPFNSGALLDAVAELLDESARAARVRESKMRF